MIKTFKYRIYPTTRQTETLESHLAICCELYNAALQERREAWRVERKSINLYDQINQLPGIRANRPDVAAVYSQTLQDPLCRIDEAFKAFFRRTKTKQRAGYPRFRSVRRYDSLTFRQHAARASFINKLLYKAEEAGRLLVKVDPRGTSQTCICGARVRKTLAQRWHLCPNCGLSADRDHVSAQIILERGLRFQALTSPVAECVA